MNEEIHAIVARFVETLNLKTVYLFGSYVRGDHNAHDFYIVMPGKRKVTCNTTAKACMSLRGMKFVDLDCCLNFMLAGYNDCR